MKFLPCVALLSLATVHSRTVQSLAQQSANPDAQLSPQAAYEKAIRPLEITRRSPQNWSEVELDALKVARENAETECAARSPEQIAGSDLLGFARLCAFALRWEPVHEAASKYINGVQGALTEKTPDTAGSLSMAFDYEVQASLNLEDLDSAISESQQMLRTVPYDAFVSEATNSTVDSIRFTRMEQALGLLRQRQPRILALMRASGWRRTDARVPDGREDGPSPIPLHALYSDGIALAALQQLTKDFQSAATSYSELEESLPERIPPEDGMYIAEARRQYRLLGQRLPTVHPVGWLLSPGSTAPKDLNTRFANATVLMLFPDWCNQCITMGLDSKAKQDELAGAGVRFYLLLAQRGPTGNRLQNREDKAPSSSESSKMAQTNSHKVHVRRQFPGKSGPEILLTGTPTVLVPNETLTDFAATDFPLIIAADRNGIVRWIQRASEKALKSDGDVNRIVNQILAMWPPHRDGPGPIQ